MTKPFPSDFLWGVATAGHQVEGNNVNSDTWFLEHLPGTIFAEPSATGLLRCKMRGPMWFSSICNTARVRRR